MEEQEKTLPQEIVYCYLRSPSEVVEYYVQPTPMAGQPPEPVPSRKRKRRGLRRFLLCLGILLAIAVCGLAAYCICLPAPKDGVTVEWFLQQEGLGECYLPCAELVSDGSRFTYEIAHGEELSPGAVYEKVLPSTVTIVASGADGESVGTGVIIREDGYVLTNAHVVEGGESGQVLLCDGSLWDAELVGCDMQEDVAVLKIDAQGLPAAEIGNSDALAVGDTVYAIGNPLGVELLGTFTNGIVSAVGRAVEMDGYTLTLIQTNAALNSGNSGGPLINAYGQVVGINTLKMDSDYVTVEGLGFALPISDITYMINQILTDGAVSEEPILGCSIGTIAQTQGMVTGYPIVSVTAGFGADSAGLRVGDLAVRLNGEPLESIDQLMSVRRTLLAGETLTLGIYREGAYQELSIELMTQAADGGK